MFAKLSLLVEWNSSLLFLISGSRLAPVGNFTSPARSVRPRGLVHCVAKVFKVSQSAKRERRVRSCEGWQSLAQSSELRETGLDCRGVEVEAQEDR